MLNESKTLEQFGYSTQNLKPNSAKFVSLICDYCGKETTKPYCKFLRSRSIIAKDSCSEMQCISKKRQESFSTKYGGHPAKTDDVKRKKKNTNQLRYGCSNVFQSDEIKQKIIQTNRSKYGVDYPMQNSAIMNKSSETNQKRYGAIRPLMNPNIKKQQEETCLRLYGHKTPAATDEFKKKEREKFKAKYGVEFGSQVHMTASVVNKLNDRNWLHDQHIVQKKCLTQIAEELGLSATSKTISDYCKKHGIEVQKTIVSRQEKEICDYLRSISVNFEKSNRTIIAPQELDIYVPAHKLAIEFCGLYWHSDEYKVSSYHKDKLIACRNAGVRLITIFEDEWAHKKEIVKSKLQNILGAKDTEKTHARNCIVRISKSTKEFLEKTHLQSFAAQKISYELVDKNNKCLAVMTFGKPRYSTKHQWEIIRFSTKGLVVGGASKIFAQFVRDCNPESVISYCDLRWGTGKVYEAMGFVKTRETKPGYFYCKNMFRYSRQKFTKKKLVLLGADPNKTEYQIMKEQGFNRIYDCGHSVHEWKKQ